MNCSIQNTQVVLKIRYGPPADVCTTITLVHKTATVRLLNVENKATG
jgi:hypothetical protein